MATATPVVVQRGPVKVATIKRKVGRPTKRTAAVKDAICERLETGESLISICRDVAMPALQNVMLWLRIDSDFREQYANARECQAEVLVQKGLELGSTATPENAHAVRIQCDMIRWYAGKVKRKVYGDEPATAVTVNNVNVTLDEDTRMKLIEAHQRMQAKFSEKVITLPDRAA